MVEIFFQGNQVAVHQRRYAGARHGTAPEHMPSAHRRYAEWTPERFRAWGAAIGPHTEGLMVAIMARRRHPEQGFRTCLGVLRLFRDLDKARAEAVAARAIAFGAFGYQNIAAIITKKLDRSAASASEAAPVMTHENLRGSEYFH